MASLGLGRALMAAGAGVADLGRSYYGAKTEEERRKEEADRWERTFGLDQRRVGLAEEQFGHQKDMDLADLVTRGVVRQAPGEPRITRPEVGQRQVPSGPAFPMSPPDAPGGEGPQLGSALGRAALEGSLRDEPPTLDMPQQLPQAGAPESPPQQPAWRYDPELDRDVIRARTIGELEHGLALERMREQFGQQKELAGLQHRYNLDELGARHGYDLDLFRARSELETGRPVHQMIKDVRDALAEGQTPSQILAEARAAGLDWEDLEILQSIIERELR
ncbi:MAG TPA: hypothetical protein VNZ57_12570 [Longimicrobiales bacterium]|nr:hypothetical protein [Longimicrobiales bacterium]